ncbi:TPA: hypothetical protein DDZ86_04635 [Candidatus Dependentiae bacterium]|nr:MAG: hypothetical protein UW09_C0002G0158 [candidate division TM6 bacterium GW2011_GWF2_43_87]HBL98900.1 hypothetical protein [Candidatus Dependentiae bacterium]
MQKKSFSSFVGLSILIGLTLGVAESTQAVVSVKAPLLNPSTPSATGRFTAHASKHFKTAQAACERYLNRLTTSPSWKNVHGILSRTSSHLNNHRYAYGAGVGSFIVGGGIIWGLRKIYTLKDEIKRAHEISDRHLLRVNQLENNLQRENENLSTQNENYIRRLGNLQTNYDNLNNQFTNLNTNHTNLQNTHQNLENELKVLKDLSDKLQQEKTDLEYEKIEYELAKLKEKPNTNLNNLQNNGNDYVQLQNNYNELKNDYDKWKTEARDLFSQNRDLANENDDLENQLNELTENDSNLYENHVQVVHKLQQLKHELKLLTNNRHNTNIRQNTNTNPQRNNQANRNNLRNNGGNDYNALRNEYNKLDNELKKLRLENERLVQAKKTLLQKLIESPKLVDKKIQDLENSKKIEEIEITEKEVPGSSNSGPSGASAGETENLDIPVAPTFEEFKIAVKKIDADAKKITDSAKLIQKDLADALKKDDVETAVRAVFQKYPLIKNADPAALIARAKKAMQNDLKNSINIGNSIMLNNLGETQIIEIAKCLQQGKAIDKSGDLKGQDAKIKICIEKIARFIGRCFNSKTLTNAIKETTQEQKQALIGEGLKNVHLKKLPPLPAKEKSVEQELNSAILTHKKISSHELEELSKKANNPEKLQQLEKKLTEQDRKGTILEEIHNPNAKNRLKKVNIDYDLAKKEKEERAQIENNPLFEQILKRREFIDPEDDDDEDFE